MEAAPFEAQPEGASVVAGPADKVALDEGNVEDGRVVVDELQQVQFQCDRVVEFGLGARKFELGEQVGDAVVELGGRWGGCEIVKCVK